ncbi:hypothetical protein TRFO_05432 [Tritrichomonas foetus]|uniref:Cation efflux protein transmembrane domain-containing protein n=1 Tax=Tritrichomonas foetus TaxID=1144522 RepID=A0A1J4KAM8_9EUKA|nr:hypothetical protein TRFO_05432 [Tritrichomonas foetus]|eukprot:OHT06756.1 hypothetical protein TRFO_05432 [Tritrichomonas foetus]
MKSHDFSVIFLLTFWAWFEARRHGLEIYYSLVFTIVFLIPFIQLKRPKSYYFLFYSSFTLFISSIVLTQLTFSHQVFFCFLHIELIRSFLDKSPVSVLCVIAEFYSICLIDILDHYIIFILMLNFLATIGLYIVFDYNMYIPFNGVSTLLTSILSIFSSQTINIPLFIVFIIFSLPRFPVPFTLNETTTENMKFFFFTFLSFSVNITTFIFGVKYHSPGQQSASLMSISNNVALFLSVLSDIESRGRPNSMFSFGYERAKILCDFSMSILLLFSSYNCISITMIYIVDFDLNTRTSKDLLILTVVSCMVDIFGSLFLRSLDPRHCELLNRAELVPLIIDFTLSLATVISTSLSYFFEINIFDPIVSLATAAMFFVLSVPKFKSCFLILLEASPPEINMKELLEGMKFEARPDARLVKIGEKTGSIFTLNCQVDKEVDRGRLLKRIRRRMRGIAKDTTIEIVAI